jgi:hypothetical protein
MRESGGPYRGDKDDRGSVCGMSLVGASQRCHLAFTLYSVVPIPTPMISFRHDLLLISVKPKAAPPL